ncbi:hypothetical protein [Cupriavidus sp. GA3-3]|uniref:hypothetical protein n=1 Tax=Cupriavidus sp. GA3-3 TaxID=1229514 RepID=UPI001FEE4648|nr:hypothetical protein [Cupriavidus sp. GA3-3]
MAVISMLLLLAACASRPVNPTSAHADQGAGYRFFTRPQYSADNENLVILAFSGGGTRAAALPILRRSSQCKAPPRNAGSLAGNPFINSCRSAEIIADFLRADTEPG